MQKRTFEIVKIHSKNKNINKNIGGKYVSRTPLNAARKAFNKLLNNNTSDYNSFKIEIKEKNLDKIYKYHFTRIIKKTPLTIIRDNKKIIYKYDIFNKFIEKPKNINSKKYICTDEEKNDKKLGFCCSKTHTINKRTFQSCKNHINRIKK